MTGYGQTATSGNRSRIDVLRERRLPAWVRRWDPRWLIAAAAVVLLFCCLCGGGLLLGGIAGDDGDDARPGTERSVEPPPSASDASSPRTRPTEQPSSDEPPERVTVPAVAGKNAAVAEDELKRAGLTKIRFASGDREHQVVLLPQNWEVKSQSAPPGSTVDAAAVFVLTCTKIA